MKSFWDQHLLKIDTKGRVSMPVADREPFQGDDGGVLVRMDRHLAIMPTGVWEKYFRKFEDDESVSSEDLRVLASRASTFKLDPQGRLVINQRLRDHAGIDEQVLFVGARSHIGVYAPSVWEAIEAQANDKDSSLSRKMAGTRIL